MRERKGPSEEPQRSTQRPQAGLCGHSPSQERMAGSDTALHGTLCHTWGGGGNGLVIKGAPGIVESWLRLPGGGLQRLFQLPRDSTTLLRAANVKYRRLEM